MTVSAHNLLPGSSASNLYTITINSVQGMSTAAISDLSCLARVPIFAQLSPAEQQHVHECIRPKSYKKGEFVQLAGEYVSQLLVLNRGSVKISRTSKDGDEQILRDLIPGDYIGDTVVFTHQPADYDAVALADSTFCVLEQQSLLKLLRTYPELGIKIIADLSLKLQQAESKIESLALKSADERLLQALHDYAAGQAHFALGTTKKDLASQIGVRPETLSRSFKRLQQSGQMQVDGKNITLS